MTILAEAPVRLAWKAAAVKGGSEAGYHFAGLRNSDPRVSHTIIMLQGRRGNVARGNPVVSSSDSSGAVGAPGRRMRRIAP